VRLGEEKRKGADAALSSQTATVEQDRISPLFLLRLTVALRLSVARRLLTSIRALAKASKLLFQADLDYDRPGH
jgi:hypothetical protein